MKKFNNFFTVKTQLRHGSRFNNGKKEIEFLLYFNFKEYHVSTGRTIEPKLWLSRYECVDKRSEDATEINLLLRERLLRLEKYLHLKRALRKSRDLAEMQIILKGQDLFPEFSNSSEALPPTISEIFDLYLKKNTCNPKRKDTDYIVTGMLITDFCFKKYKKEVRVNSIDFSFLDNLKDYLRAERSRLNSKNTIAFRLKIFFTVLKFATDSQLIEKNPMEGYERENGNAKELALTEKEYQKFKTVTFTKSTCPSVRLTWKIFVFCCETGLRHSEVQNLKWEHINSEIKALSKKPVGIKKSVYDSLSNQAKAILISYKEKYGNTDGYVFPRLDNHVANRDLKYIARRAHIRKDLTTLVASYTFETRLESSIYNNLK